MIYVQYKEPQKQPNLFNIQSAKDVDVFQKYPMLFKVLKSTTDLQIRDYCPL